MLRYDPAGEFDFHDDFGWLDITHGLTYANAARWHAGTPGRRSRARVPTPSAGAVVRVPRPLDRSPRVAHRRSASPSTVDLGTADVVAAGQALQRQALDDTTTAFIVHAHAVKTSRAASEEAARSGSLRPLEAAARFLEAPKLERFVAATVTRSIDFLSGRTPRD